MSAKVLGRFVSGPPEGWQESFRYDLGHGRVLHGYSETWTPAGNPGRHWRGDSFHGIVRFEHVCDRGDRGVIVCAPELQIGHGHTVTGTAHGPTVMASISCPDCGTHGFVTEGVWTDA
jgi:hypothetical protein